MNTVKKAGKALQWLGYYAITGVHFILLPWAQKRLFKASWKDVWRNVKTWAKKSNQLFGVQIELQNPHEVALDQQYILVSNHRSWFDQLVLTELFPQPIHFLAKKGYFELPIYGQALSQLIEAIPVENKKLSLHTFGHLMHCLKRGDTTLFYIEGTRGTGKELLPFNSGAFKVAAKLGIPILPIYLFGTEQILSKQHSLLTVRGGKATVIIDQPQSFSRENWEAEMAAFEQEYRQKHEGWYGQYTETI